MTAAILAATAFIAAPSATAAAKSTVYNNVPAPLPGNVPSVGFEANAASEFGGQVELGGSARSRANVKIVMSSWGCQNGSWSAGNCSSTKHSTFNAPLTLNVYAVGEDDAPGALITTVTHTFAMPYRPSANYTKCTAGDAGKWYDKGTATCYNGMAFTVSMRLGSADLPDRVILSVAYNTTHSGYDPIGESTECFTSSGGCPYDALNVGTSDSSPTAGSQPLPDDAYINSSQDGVYCDGGADGTGSFRLDAGCWTGLQPAFLVKAA